MHQVKVAATQMSCSWNLEENIQKAEILVRNASLAGANIILIQELFQTPYFCQVESPEYFKYAHTTESDPAIKHFQKIAHELNVVLPISFFEKYNQAYYNSIVVIDADGSISPTYRKSHIPDGPGYEEKYYFNPGDTGFMVFNTKFAKIGIGICWDQWYPELARCLVLKGAEILLYPTAIGSEPQNEGIHSKDHWQTCMLGHAGANLVPVVASNRIGFEQFGNSSINFYGSSFIADQFGKKITEMKQEEGFIYATFNLNEISIIRRNWGIFRDRRPDLYHSILSYDGDNCTIFAR